MNLIRSHSEALSKKRKVYWYILTMNLIRSHSEALSKKRKVCINNNILLDLTDIDFYLTYIFSYRIYSTRSCTQWTQWKHLR